MQSLRKFSYWSSPQISTRSGANSSSLRRSVLNAATSRRSCSRAAPTPSSAPHSASISFGQPLVVGVQIGRNAPDLDAALQHARPVLGRHQQPGIVGETDA
jgi:hypothetical protein